VERAQPLLPQSVPETQTLDHVTAQLPLGRSIQIRGQGVRQAWFLYEHVVKMDLVGAK